MVQTGKTQGSVTTAITREIEIVASGTTAGEENTEEESSDHLTTEQGAETGISLVFTDELTYLLLASAVFVAIALATGMFSRQRQK